MDMRTRAADGFGSSPFTLVETPRAASSRAEPLRVEVRRPHADPALEDAWRRLADRALERNVFCEPDFVLSAGQHLLEGRGLQLLLVWQGNVLRGVFPITRPALGALTGQMHGWRPPLSAEGVPLVDADGAEATIEAALAWLAQKERAIAGLVFSQIPSDGAFARALRAVAERSGRTFNAFDMHRRAVLSRLPLAEVEAGIRQKTLRELRRQRRRMAELGEVRVERARDPKAVREAVEEFLALEAAGWKGRRGTALIQQAGTASFVRVLTRRLARKGNCRVHILRVGGRAVAAGIVLFSGRQGWFWKIAYDETFARFSPGVQLTLEITRALTERAGIDVTDSCAVENHPMIDHLWRERMGVADYFIAAAAMPSARARATLVSERVRRSVREAAKRAYSRLAGT